MDKLTKSIIRLVNDLEDFLPFSLSLLEDGLVSSNINKNVNSHMEIVQHH